jgi:hypothetical protein
VLLSLFFADFCPAAKRNWSFLTPNMSSLDYTATAPKRIAPGGSLSSAIGSLTTLLAL